MSFPFVNLFFQKFSIFKIHKFRFQESNSFSRCHSRSFFLFLETMDADDEQKPFDNKNPSNNRSFRSNSQQNHHQNNQNHPSQQQNPFGSITSTFSSQINSQSQTSINSASTRENNNNGSGDRNRPQNTARPAPLQPANLQPGTYLLVGNNSQNRPDSLANSSSPAVAAPFSSTEISSQTSQNSQNTNSSHATTVSTASPLIQTVEIL